MNLCKSMAGVMFQGNSNVAKAENPADLFHRWLKPTGIKK
jgi:hypothetical protein